MKEENKYYTPTLEELHVGFEFEYLDDDDRTWNKTIIKHQSELCNWTAFDDINKRVKYLDKEDIESLGFILKREFNCFIKTDIYNVDCFIYFNPWYTQIKVGSDITKTKQVFEGRIKNKSELQQILKMVL